MIMSRFATLFSTLTGRSDVLLVDALHEQLEAALKGAELARSLVSYETSQADAHRLIGDIEHEGDLKRGELVQLLSRSITTPIDREDMFRLSRSIDDILDTLRDFIREAHIYDVQDFDALVPLVLSTVSGVSALQAAVDAIVSDPAEVMTLAQACKSHANSIARAYQYEVASLFNGDVSADTLKRRELARRLDNASARLSEAANALADGAIKRWH
jgi:uncharacterized protein Yka (UPF0111/DUF47 family)